MTDKEGFLSQARTYIGKNGRYVCIEKLNIGFICDWCAFSVSAVMNDCGFIGKYIKAIEGGAGTIPRYSDGKFGQWFKKGIKTPQAGDLFFLRYADYPTRDKYFCDHVGIVESISGNAITTLEGNVDGISGNWAATSTFKRKTRYLSDSTVYAFYRPNWQGENKTTTSSGNKTTTTSNTQTAPDILYQVHASGRWLPYVKNLTDYAGLSGKPIYGMQCKVTKGHIRYRVHLIGGGWLPWVTDTEDFAGASKLNRQIDCVQMELVGLSGYTVKYRVKCAARGAYLPYVTGWNDKNSDGYAGIYGVSIDRLQAIIVKK